MEEFLTSYHISYDEFKPIMTSTNSIIAGSAPLACYLAQQGLDPGFEPANLDIFVETPYDVQGSIMSFLVQQDISKIFHFLVRAGYNTAVSSDEEPTMHNVKFVIHLIHPSNKKINIFVVRHRNLLEYIYTHFDLSGCMTWWDANANTLQTVYPEFTSKKEMHPCDSDDLSENRSEHYLARVEKYKSRGFTFYERPPNYVVKQDDRADLETILQDKSAFDVIAYEDVSCVEYLRSSPWNILLQIGDKYHAYRRDVLYKTMMDTEAILPHIGYVYDTPHHHTVTRSALNHLLYADYSIYELSGAYTIPFGLNRDQTKTLYTMKCYDLSHYSQQRYNQIIYAPSAPSAPSESEESEEKDGSAAPLESQDDNNDDDDLPHLINNDYSQSQLLSEEEWMEYNQYLIENEIIYPIQNEQ